MRKGLYAGLAADNIKRNSQTYLPYLITCIITSAMVYIIKSLSLNPDLDNVIGGDALQMILTFGSYVTMIFAFIFLFYTNSFLMKRRKKELGLYNILGMEKRHIAKVLLTETIYTAVISLAIGLTVGILLDKLLFLLLTKMLGSVVPFGFYISVESLAVTCIFMLCAFLLIYLNALRQIHLAKPIELLHGSGMGEKEPKAKWLLALLGVVFLGTGYYIAIVTTQPLQALMLFFVAVVCVIIGTYLLFTAGIIAFLKILKRNKKYYYRINHFTSVSGMIYRMKQNAVGLANICILSTMVLVMVSSTSCLLAGQEDIINTRYPFDFMVSLYDGGTQDKVERYLSDNKVDVEKSVKYTSLTFETVQDESRFYIPEETSVDTSDLCEIGIIYLEDYNRLTGENIELAENEILLFSDDKEMQYDKINLLGRDLSVARRLDDFPIGSTDVVKCASIVVSGEDVMQDFYEAQKAAYGENFSLIRYYYNFSINSGDEKELYRGLHDYLNINADYGFRIDAKYTAHESYMSLYGGLFFLGAFLGTLFLMQTVLIIYYKQISEGFDDKKRFEIMQNVGMSKTEVRKSIHSQIITVFFLPLVTAGIHTAFSFPLICRMFVVVQMRNTDLFIICLLICFAAFSLIYALIYSITAKTYYRIVSK
ncbi:MAG: ABC transporter permease [Eubacterium sp.]|nr:ABC transporter permease [Eubacterium sp.]